MRGNELRINAGEYEPAESSNNEGSRNSPPQTVIHAHTGHSSPEQSCPASRSVNILPHNTARHNPIARRVAFVFLG